MENIILLYIKIVYVYAFRISVFVLSANNFGMSCYKNQKQTKNHTANKSGRIKSRVTNQTSVYKAVDFLQDVLDPSHMHGDAKTMARQQDVPATYISSCETMFPYLTATSFKF